MNKLIQSLNNLDVFTAEISGTVHLNVFKTTDDDFAELVLNSKDHTYDFEDGILKLNDNSETENFNEFKNFTGSVFDVIKTIVTKCKDKSNQIKPMFLANIYINHIQDINISGDNINISINDVTLCTVNINSSNLTINTEQSRIKDLQIRTSNLNGSFVFNENNKKINIIGNNAKINIIKDDFNGKIDIKSNNSNYKQNAVGDALIGEFSANLNNSRINIV